VHELGVEIDAEIVGFEQLPLLAQERVETFAGRRIAELDPGEAAGELGGVAPGPLLDEPDRGLRHRARLFEHHPQGRAEPALHRALQQLVGEERERQHRQQREADMGEHQLGAEPRSEMARAILEPGFEDVAAADE